MEDQEIVITEPDSNHPVLLLPRNCTMLETNCAVADDVFINLNITSQDTEGNDINVYSGFCSVKVINNCNIEVIVNEESVDTVSSPTPIVVSDAGSQDSFPDGQIWIDEVQSPQNCNSYGAMESEGQYSYNQSHSGNITVEQHNTYITQNVYNYNEPVQCSMNGFEHKKFGRVHVSENQSINPTLEEEIECGIFLTQLSEDIMIGTERNENKAQEELRSIGLQSDNEALTQLMSSDIQSLPKQKRTILYFGNNFHNGQTIQKIAVNDPAVRCRESDINRQFDTDTRGSNQKKYQCDKCKQIFDQINSFRLHIQGTHKTATSVRETNSAIVEYVCYICKKVMKTEKKLDDHVLRHGNPELECAKCHKVFASKFTLRNHWQLHLRSHRCTYCANSYHTINELKTHRTRMHYVFNCNACDFFTTDYSEINDHYEVHTRVKDDPKNDSLSLDGDFVNQTNPDLAPVEDVAIQTTYEDLKGPDAVIAKVMSNKIFKLSSKKAQRHRIKTCSVCRKTFDRVSDLKRHLIEHVIQSTLAKAPVKNGSLHVTCEICKSAVFSKVDKYKAHLREHAQLTLYKCIVCDKSFSDSSNFSKHKKTHGTTCLQCDLCQRKFNSKKMLTRHIEYHSKSIPIDCCFCDKQFYFPSTLKRHVKVAHQCAIARWKCKFCQVYFKTLKEKWDHEWAVHNFRKTIVDCFSCDSKFRKYTQLKYHCKLAHGVNIPPAADFLK